MHAVIWQQDNGLKNDIQTFRFVKCTTRRQIFLIQNSHLRRKKKNNYDRKQFHLFHPEERVFKPFVHHTCPLCVSHNSHCWFGIPQREVKIQKQQMFLNPRSWETACLFASNRQVCAKTQHQSRIQISSLGVSVKGLAGDGFTRDPRWGLDEKTWQFDAPLWWDWRWESVGPRKEQPQRQRKRIFHTRKRSLKSLKLS